MALNLSKFATKDSDALHLRNPATDELLYDEVANADGSVTKLPVEIVVNGPSSPAYRNAITAMQNRMIKRGKQKQSAEAMREEGIDLLVACSVKANNLVLPDGSPIDNDAAFKKLYSDPQFGWLKDQVDAGLGDVSNFLGK